MTDYDKWLIEFLQNELETYAAGAADLPPKESARRVEAIDKAIAILEQRRMPSEDRFGLTEEEQETINEGLVFLRERDFPEAAKLLRRMFKRAHSAFRPDWASPPGDTIKDMMEYQGKEVDEVDFCRNLGIHPSTVELLFEGQLRINEQMAQALGDWLGPSAEFWMEREHTYQSALVRLDPHYVPQGRAREVIATLCKVLGGPPKGQGNTLSAMVHTLVELYEMTKTERDMAAATAGQALKTSIACPFCNESLNEADLIITDALETIAAMAPAVSGRAGEGEVLYRRKPADLLSAYHQWKKSSPFGDNALVRAGFRAGWAAVFKVIGSNVAYYLDTLEEQPK